MGNRMSAGAPWSVKGIDAKAREVAKDLARRSGLTLGEWLNQMILEGEDVGAAIRRERERRDVPTREDYAESDYEDGYAAPQPAARRRPPVYREVQNDIAPPPVTRRAPAFSSASQPLSSRDLRRRSIFEDRPREGAIREERYRDERPRYEEPGSAELGRVANALESLSARIEGSESRSASAVRGVSTAVEALLGRLERSEAALERSEAAHDETRGRLEEAAQDIRDDLRQSFDRHEESREALQERLEQAERLIDAQAERLEGLSGHLRDERERVARVEAELKNPANDGVRLVEGALGKLANQLYENEQRTRDTTKDIREDMVGLSHRLTQMELRDPDRAAQALIDKVVTQLAQRLEQAEAQTSGAIKALEQAFSTLDARLSRAEERGDVTDPESVQSLQGLATELSRRVESSRAELLNAMQDRTQASAEELLSTLSRRIEETEHRSAAAIEKLGEDVMRIADNLNNRVGGIEAAGQEGLARVENEVRQVENEVRQIGSDLDARIDSKVGSAIDTRMESRFESSESSHAQALERLGAEIARISERLSSRVGDSERRAAQAIEGIGQFVEQSRDDARSELSARIRQSEERTARQLEETRRTLDQKLARVAAHSLLSESAARGGMLQSRLRSDLPNPFDAAPAYSAPFDSGTLDSGALDAGADEDLQPTAEVAKPMAQRVTFAPVQGGYEDDDYADESDLSDQPDQTAYAAEEDDTAEELTNEDWAAEQDRVETARIEAFAEDEALELEPAEAEDHLDLTQPVAQTEAETDFNPFVEDDLDSDLEPAASTEPEVIKSPLGPRANLGSVARVQSAVAALTARDNEDDSDPFADIEVSRKTAPLRPAAPRGSVSFTPVAPARDIDDEDMDAFTPSRAQAPTVEEDAGVSVSTRDALAAARAAVRASMDNIEPQGSGFGLQPGISRARMAEARAAKVKKESGMLLNAFKASVVAVVAVCVVAGGYVALTKKEEEPLAATAVSASLPNSDQLNAEYESAQKALEARAPNAIGLLQKVADKGLAKAQFRLGSLYRGEGALVKEDPVQARQWTEKAASAGVTPAMYNLGLFYYNGYGGAQNHIVAANWFRKSAENGLFDGQYNLGLMYQQGDGVPLDPSEAYKWLKLAAKAKPNDREAAALAAEARNQLSADQAARADDAVAQFVPNHSPADADVASVGAPS